MGILISLCNKDLEEELKQELRNEKNTNRILTESIKSKDQNIKHSITMMEDYFKRLSRIKKNLEKYNHEDMINEINDEIDFDFLSTDIKLHLIRTVLNRFYWKVRI